MECLIGREGRWNEIFVFLWRAPRMHFEDARRINQQRGRQGFTIRSLVVLLSHDTGRESARGRVGGHQS